jgi:hypothetical protein
MTNETTIKKLQEGIRSAERNAKMHESAGDMKLKFYYEGKADAYRVVIKAMQEGNF